MTGMRVAITQPYLFPHVAWYQVIRACDTFVISDDVQFIKSGYINRNRILLAGVPVRFIVPLRRASHAALIGERRISGSAWIARFLKTVRAAYGRAPHFGEVFPMIEEVVAEPAEMLVDLLERAIVRTARHLGLMQPIVRASSLPVRAGLRKEWRVLATAEAMGARCYLQRETEAARTLYRHEVFAARGIELRFVRIGSLPYAQRGVREFIPGLSLIDFLMQVAPEDRGRHLMAYDIVE